MKPIFAFIIALFTISSQVASGQTIDGFLDAYHFNKNFLNIPSKDPNKYKDIDGNPYLTKEFTNGILYLKDSTAVKLPLRYNIYTNEMEYELDGVTYVVGNPRVLKKIVLGESVFVYLPAGDKGGFFELLVSGKCFLVQKRSVTFHPAEGPKPIVGSSTPARFDREPDTFFIGNGDSKTAETSTLKAMVIAFQDQKSRIGEYIKTEKIKRANRENLIKIVTFYNSL